MLFGPTFGPIWGARLFGHLSLRLSGITRLFTWKKGVSVIGTNFGPLGGLGYWGTAR